MYEFELNMNKEDYQNKMCIDEWGVAYLWDNIHQIGAEYNYAIDDGENYCAIYMFEESDDKIWTDTSRYRHYEIEWDKDDWALRLKNAMIEFIKENINESY